MSAAPATRYTDRDVRESAELADMALRYALNYHGEFEFLTDAKHHAQVEGTLTVALARGVLNCMRNDARVAAELPPPAYYADDKVVPMSTQKNKKKRYNLDCNNLESHDGHSWYEVPETYQGLHFCEGVPFPIMRKSSISMKLRVNVPYVVSKNRHVMIHASVPDSDRNRLEWRPNRHDWGFKGIYGYGDLWLTAWIKIRCKYPSILRDPLLLTQEQADGMIEIGTMWCPHCFPEH
jgi:hypothetical protein